MITKSKGDSWSGAICTCSVVGVACAGDCEPKIAEAIARVVVRNFRVLELLIFLYFPWAVFTTKCSLRPQLVQSRRHDGVWHPSHGSPRALPCINYFSPKPMT